MTKSAEQLFAQVMQLAAVDRADFLERLDESTDMTQDARYIAEWDEEIQSRIDSVERGEETPIPWREAMAQIRRGEVDDK